MAKKPVAKPAAEKKSTSELAREYHKANPKATTQEIADHLKTSYNNIYQALHVGKKKAKAKAAGPKASKNGASPLEAIRLAKQFADAVGGTAAASEILAALGK
jgi:predicted HTH transcriptional regulator